MENVVQNRRDARSDDLDLVPADRERQDAGLAMWAGGFLGFAAGAAVVVMAMAVITTESLAGAVLTENLGAEVLSVDGGVLLGTAVGLLLGVVAGWLAARSYYRARNAPAEGA